MLRVSETMDPILARPFGISSIISKRSLELVYNTVGKGTNMLSRLEPGRMLDMLGPLGNGFSMPEKGEIPVLIAGGCGFPPLHFLSIKFARRKIKSHVFIGAKDRRHLPPPFIMNGFKKNLCSIHLATEDGSAGTRGLVTQLVSKSLQTTGTGDERRPVLYACGPRAMLAAVAALAAEHSVTCYVSMEERMACGMGACMGCAVPVRRGGYKRVCKDGPIFRAEEIAWSESDLTNPSSVAQCCSHAVDAIPS